MGRCLYCVASAYPCSTVVSPLSPGELEALISHIRIYESLMIIEKNDTYTAVVSSLSLTCSKNTLSWAYFAAGPGACCRVLDRDGCRLVALVHLKNGGAAKGEGGWQRSFSACVLVCGPFSPHPHILTSRLHNEKLLSCYLDLSFPSSLELLFPCSLVLLFFCPLLLFFCCSLVLLLSCALVLLCSCAEAQYEHYQGETIVTSHLDQGETIVTSHLDKWAGALTRSQSPLRATVVQFLMMLLWQ